MWYVEVVRSGKEVLVWYVWYVVWGYPWCGLMISPCISYPYLYVSPRALHSCQLPEAVRAGDAVLYHGCGCGVLGLLALRAGAASVHFVNQAGAKRTRTVTQCAIPVRRARPASTVFAAWFELPISSCACCGLCAARTALRRE